MFNTKQTDFTEYKKYIWKIIFIIFLLCLPSIAMVFADYKTSIGWITGAIASAANFWFMSYKLSHLHPASGGKANAIKTASTFIFRFLFLIVWAGIVLLIIKPNILAFCFGLFAAQIAIVLYHVYCALTKGGLKKYMD
jgi:hypothetical protein